MIPLNSVLTSSKSMLLSLICVDVRKYVIKNTSTSLKVLVAKTVNQQAFQSLVLSSPGSFLFGKYAGQTPVILYVNAYQNKIITSMLP